MYSLDVNFLNDDKRGGTTGSGPVKATKRTPTKEFLPLALGLAVALLPLGLVAGLWFFGEQKTAQLTAEENRLKSELDQLKVKVKEIDNLQAQINQVNAETKALASVFYQVKPWSAMMQDMRDRVPPGLQISTVLQTETALAPSTPAATPTPGNAKAQNQTQNQTAQLPTTKLEIAGISKSFNDVNDFMLTLQRSSFFNKDQTQLVSAALVNNPIKLELPKAKTESGAGGVAYELPKVVEYRIQTSLKDLTGVPTSELIRELNRKGAVGLETRLRTLQNKGVNQQ